MTDNFERAMQDIALKDGEPTARDILTALKATNDDLDDQHAKTELWHQKLIERLDGVDAQISGHVSENRHFKPKEFDEFIKEFDERHKDRDRRLAEAEERIESKLDKALEDQEQAHETFHNKHLAEDHGEVRRGSDEPSSDYRSLRRMLPDEFAEMTVGWRVGRWLVMIIVIALVGWSVSFWGNSCARPDDKPEVTASVPTATPTQ